MRKGRSEEARLGAAIGRFILGALLGGLLWLVLLLGQVHRYWGPLDEAIFEWFARLRVFAGFFLGGGLLGLLVGDRFFRDLSGSRD